MRLWRTCGYDNTIDAFIPDSILYLFLSIPGAGEHLGAGVFDPWESIGEFHHFLDIDYASNVAPAMTDENTYARRPCDFKRYNFREGGPIAICQITQRQRRSPAALGYTVWNIFGTRDTASGINSRSGGRYKTTAYLVRTDKTILDRKSVV